TGSLIVSWGVSSEEGLAGFRVRYRPVSIEPQPWIAPVERPPSARREIIRGLGAQPYEVLVRTVLTSESPGRMVRAIGTPLTGEPPEEPPEEPPVEEPPPEEPPVEEPPIEEPP